MAILNKHPEYRDRYGNDCNRKLRNSKDLQVNRRSFGVVSNLISTDGERNALDLPRTSEISSRLMILRKDIMPELE